MRLEKTANGRAACFVLFTKNYFCYKSRRMRWAWHIARMWEKTAGDRKNPLGKLSVDGKIILIYIYKTKFVELLII